MANKTNGQEILLVDDSAFMRTIVRNILKKYGYTNIREADTGMEGLLEYKKKKADLVILDIIMPAMDGLQALKALKEHDPDVRVVMITAVGQEEIMKECDKLGIGGYITKPFKEEAVYFTVKGIIGPAVKKKTRKEK